MSNTQPKTDENILAYHESGHVLAKILKPGLFDFTSVTISAEGENPGSFKVKLIDNVQDEKNAITNEMITLMAGCASEETMLGKQAFPVEDTSDYHKAYELASHYIDKYGVPQDLSVPFAPQKDNNFSFLSGIMEHFKKHSHLTQEDTEQAKHDFIYEAFDQACILLENNSSTLDAMANELLDKKTLSKEEATQMVLNHSPAYQNANTL